jgi:site-specific recombinase XerC
MGKFSFYLDKRGKKNKPHDYKYSLCVRSNIKDDTIYLPITTDKKRKEFVKLTEEQYKRVFVKKSLDTQSIDFRVKCSTYITRCEKVLSSLGENYTRTSFVELYKSEGEIVEEQPFTSLKLTDVLEHYINNTTKGSVKYRGHIKTSVNVFNTFKSGLSITDITPDFLERLKNWKKDDKKSEATIQSYNRDIRKLINYTKDTLKILPKEYQYPYGGGGYTIGSYFPPKVVMSNEDILKVVELNDFDCPEQKYSRDIWLFLYRCNGINFIDLLNMKWDNIVGDYFIFTRWKTRNTRKNNIKPIKSPITNGIKELLKSLGDKSSPYILGELKEGSKETTIINKCEKLKSRINKHLKVIGKKLNLPVELLTETARDCYATTLYRNGVSKENIGEMLGHSNSIVTEHYLSGIDIEKTNDINKHIL